MLKITKQSCNIHPATGQMTLLLVRADGVIIWANDFKTRLLTYFCTSSNVMIISGKIKYKIKHIKKYWYEKDTKVGSGVLIFYN